MKTCTKCFVSKNESDFNLKSKALGKLQSACKECTRKQIRKHYSNNKDYYIRKAKKRNLKVRGRVRNYIWKYLEKHPCIDCGENDPVVLEFDHQHSKKISISHAAQNSYTIEKLKEEMSKCVVRCANCHRRKTADELGWFKGN